MSVLNETHDPARKSWVESANGPGDFPIQNLPFCMFVRGGQVARPGVAIGDCILDLIGAAELNLLGPHIAPTLQACFGTGLNSLMRLDRGVLSSLRKQLSELLLANNETGNAHRDKLLVARDAVALCLPAEIGAFTDFFTSLHHTERGGRVTRPDNPVPPNFRYMPIAYNSRASSVRISGEDVRRPNGQWRKEDGTVQFGPTEALDFELELGAFVGKGNELGIPIPIGGAEDHIFGYCLLNDWSARDVQRWESFPLGPFLSKSLSTSISPFVVTSEALAPFRTAALQRPKGDPPPLAYLYAESDQQFGGLNLFMEALIQTTKMRDSNEPPFLITRTNFKEMYWTVAQMLAHHTSNGCNLCTGDLIGSGTASGSTEESRACLSEIAASKRPIEFPNGELRVWLEDGDVVLFRARAERDGYVSVGFGECKGRVVAAQAQPLQEKRIN
ncbi:MAG: fahA [Bradyrhizobium sp.]|nr:fahA [Bradyrhizobium sp.]